MPQKDTVLVVIFRLLSIILLYRVLPAGVSSILHCQVISSVIKIAHVAICNFLLDTPGLAHAQGLLCDTEWEEGYQDTTLAPWISKHLANTWISYAFSFLHRFQTATFLQWSYNTYLFICSKIQVFSFLFVVFWGIFVVVVLFFFFSNHIL